MQLAVISAVIVIIAAVIGAIATGAAGCIQANAARQVTESQKRSLFLELIDRRATWLDNAKILCNKWMIEIGGGSEPKLAGTSRGIRYFEVGISVYRRDAQWLFGDNVIAQLDAVEAAIKDYGRKQKQFDDLSSTAPQEESQIDRLELQVACVVSKREAEEQRNRLSDALRPYLYVGDIKVPDQLKPPALVTALQRLPINIFKGRQQPHA